MVIAIAIGTLLISGTRRPPSTDPEAQVKIPATGQVANTAPGPAAPLSDEAVNDRSGEVARRLIAEVTDGVSAPDLDAVFVQAGELLSQGKVADAHLLYFFAARQGHRASAFALGTIYDPNHFSKEQSLLGRPDPVQARKWYRIAAKEGHNVARTRLLGLEDWVAARAESGDREAQRLLLSWR